MAKFSFKYYDENFPETTVSYEVGATNLTEILSHIAHFLKACGFILPVKDYPIIVDDDEG